MNDYLHSLRVRADRLLLAVCAIAGVVSLGIASGNGSWAVFLLVSLPTLLVQAALVALQPASLLTRCVTAVATMVLSAALIQQAHGMLEMHFTIFVLLALLVYYRDWVPVVLAAATIAVHHAAFGWLQAQGAPLWAFPDGGSSFTILLIHAAFVVVESAFVVVMAIGLERDARRLGADPVQLRNAASQLALGNLEPVQQLAANAPNSAARALGEAAQALDATMQSIAEVVQAAAAGDFTRRVAAPASEGSVGRIVEAVNRGTATSAAAIGLLAEGLGQMERGVLPVVADDRELRGDYARLAASLRSLIEVFSRFRDQQSRAVDAFSAGDTRQQLSLDGLQGFQRELAVGINRLFDEVNGLLGDVSAYAAALRAGELVHRMPARGQGEFARIARDANAALQSLADLVGGIRGAARDIHDSADQIGGDTRELAGRIERQAANLEQTASSMEQLTATVQQNADGAGRARELADGATRVAEQGGQLVQDVVRTMDDIRGSSTRIADIIGVIDGIAFQTNILALNAAVEAARAGEQGRGFAVVASEVRALAQRSADAAREIKGLIAASVADVESGTGLVGRAGTTMAEIVDAVRRVSGLVAEISAASREQAQGIAAVGGAVADMDHTTQENAGLVGRASAQGEALTAHAARLQDAVATFRVAG